MALQRPARRSRRKAAAVTAAIAAATYNPYQHSAEAFQPPVAPSLPQHLLVASDAPPLSQSQPQHLCTRRNHNCMYKQRGSASSPLAVSASASQGDSSESSSPADLQNLAENAFSTLSSAADQVQQNANDWTDEYVDEYELEQEELSKRRARAAAEAAERRRQYEVTVPLTASTNSYSQPDAMMAATATMVGMTLRQISPGGQISAQALDLDAASLLSNLSTEEELDPTRRDGDGLGSVEILPALLQMEEGGGSMVGDTATSSSSSNKSRGGRGGSRVVVSSVVRDGAAWASGVRPGDVVLATSATVGQVRTCSYLVGLESVPRVVVCTCNDDGCWDWCAVILIGIYQYRLAPQGRRWDSYVARYNICILHSAFCIFFFLSSSDIYFGLWSSRLVSSRLV